MPYIIELANDDRVEAVDVVVGETISESRLAMGWELPEEKDGKFFLQGCNVHICPNEQEMVSLFEECGRNSVHLFSGIRGFAFVYKCFCESLKYNIKRGIITERPNTFAFGLANGKPLWLHRLRFWLQDRKYIPYIHYVFAIGEECADYYRSISNKWKVIPFAYCTSNPSCLQGSNMGGGNLRRKPFEAQERKTVDESSRQKSKTNQPPQIIYIGTMAWWKNVTSLLVADVDKSDINIDLVGDGPQRLQLESLVEKLQLKDVHFLGYQKNSDIPAIMSTHDVLVLPSIYDGWGAVVNEALMNGLFVICSDKCGAKDMIRSIDLGLVFRGGSERELVKCLIYVKKNINTIRQNRLLRKQWAEEHISGKAISKYMVDCLSGQNVTPPWREE